MTPTFRAGAVARAAVVIAALLLAGLLAFLVAGHVAQLDAAGVAGVHQPSVRPPTPASAPLTDIGRADLASVVTVEAQLPNEESLGTGWLFDTKGDFVTNAHVVAGQIAIRITDRNDHIHVAVVLGIDVSADIAVLRATGGFAGTPLPLDASPLGSTGAAVIALASSRATGQVDLTPGLTIVGLDQDVPLSGGDVQPGQAAPAVYHHMLHVQGQRIYQGNSGGPLLDGAGAVVGIVTLASPSSPDAYAIPIARVLGELDQFAMRNG